MTEISMGAGNGENLPLTSLPKTALQAIYHAVTGKTENLSKNLHGNVLIRNKDIDNLYAMVVDQIGHYDTLADPTITINIKCANNRSLTYSSWERYSALRIGNNDVTSEITIKFEFVIQLPGTPKPQRLSLSINLDSALPVIAKEFAPQRDEPVEFMFFLRSEWRAVEISIDFVDFLIAKIFSGVVEEWFATLDKPPVSKFGQTLSRNRVNIINFVRQMPEIGLATYLAAYVVLTQWKDQSLPKVVMATALGIGLVAVGRFFWGTLLNRMLKKILAGLIPTILLLNDSDEKVYKTVIDEEKKARNNLSVLFVSVIFSIIVNLGSSFLYTYLTK